MQKLLTVSMASCAITCVKEEDMKLSENFSDALNISFWNG